MNYRKGYDLRSLVYHTYPLVLFGIDSGEREVGEVGWADENAVREVVQLQM